MNFTKFNVGAMLVQTLRFKTTRVACVALAVLAQASALFASEGAEAEAKLEPLAWQTDLAIWTAVVFILLLCVLGVFAFKPIVKALDKRENDQLENLAKIEKANADARELLEQYQQKLADSEEEVRRMLNDAKSDAENKAQIIVGEAKEAAELIRAKAVKDIEIATDGALQEIAVKGADLATELAAKILKQSIDTAKHAQIVEVAAQKIGDRE